LYVQIATPECVYIFDMLWISDLALQLGGLGEVLESEKILKVRFCLLGFDLITQFSHHGAVTDTFWEAFLSTVHLCGP